MTKINNEPSSTNDYFESFNLIIEEKEGRGRCVFATTNFEAGDLIFHNLPFSSYISANFDQ
eukprot:Pgem_evm1s2323